MAIRSEGRPQLALTFRPLAQQVRTSLTQERVIALLAALFGALAVLLAGLGLYGVTSPIRFGQRVCRRNGDGLAGPIGPIPFRPSEKNRPLGRS